MNKATILRDQVREKDPTCAEEVIIDVEGTHIREIQRICNQIKEKLMHKYGVIIGTVTDVINVPPIVPTPNHSYSLYKKGSYLNSVE